MKILIQLVLILSLVVVVVRLVSNRGDRTKAMRRVGMFVFALFGVYSVLFPATWTAMARKVGVGRGTDLLLYVLVVAFLAFTMNTYLRFREMETRYTRLARRIALDEAEAAYPHIATGAPVRSGTMPPAATPGAPRSPGQGEADRTWTEHQGTDGNLPHRTDPA